VSERFDLNFVKLKARDQFIRTLNINKDSG
jgi:hypothetical protein